MGNAWCAAAGGLERQPDCAGLATELPEGTGEVAGLRETRCYCAMTTWKDRRSISAPFRRRTKVAE